MTNQTTQGVIDTLVRDRTQADVAAKNEKGTYNAADLNRVGAAVEHLAACIRATGQQISVNPKTDWVMTDIPSVGQMEQYSRDVAALRAALTMCPDTPQAPQSLHALTWQTANGIEQILFDVDMLLQNMAQTFPRCGAVGCEGAAFYFKT